MDSLGLSCQRYCVYGPRVLSGIIPVSDIQALVGEDGVWIRQLGAAIAGRAFAFVICYHRQLPSGQDKGFTVSDAKDVLGKVERCRLDPGYPFRFHWATAQHGLLTLKERLMLESAEELCRECGDHVLFEDTTFKVSAWLRCPDESLAVKMPFVFVRALQQKETDLNAFLAKKLSLAERTLVRGLLVAFRNVPTGSPEGQYIGDLLTTVWDSDPLGCLPSDIKRAICGAIMGNCDAEDLEEEEWNEVWDSDGDDD